ncbi:hypothetical protein VNI00_015113 [Paramarasmius palmivorus]|uniref:Uncharacterized protein n=1 Tax=Paramarasmius palmivorus TaxID=297713 RepID=A0AAW0BNW1_9AGAR
MVPFFGKQSLNDKCSVLSILPIALSFQIVVPGTITADSRAVAEWKRTEGDPSTFGLLLRTHHQLNGGGLLTVVSTSDFAGQITFTAKVETQYLFEIVTDTSPFGPNDQPKQILATSNGFSAVRDSDTPPVFTQTASTSLLPNTTQTIAFEHGTANSPSTTNSTQYRGQYNFKYSRTASNTPNFGERPHYWVKFSV